VLTQDLQRRLDPFLMLDAFGTDNPDDYIGGFPDHPHRGFETVTYMLAGRMRHRDSAGHEGLLVPGGVQWMTAGRGVIHSEMPEQTDGRDGRLPAVAEPAGARQDVRALVPRHRRSEIPEWQGARRHRARDRRPQPRRGRRCGAREATAAAVPRPAPRARRRFEQPLPAGHNAFVYVYRGELDIGAQPVRRQRMAILANTAGSDGVVLTAGAEGARAILVAGRPLKRADRPVRPVRDEHLVVGVALFLVGMGINLWADTALIKLRATGDGYQIPRGGLYEWISCPNYFGEILEWCGWALATGSLAGVAFAVYTAANIGPRAIDHHRWYRERFPDYPPERRALIPWVL
jgi:redox-sensitive bicupin YhaK (pirin superfamily)